MLFQNRVESDQEPRWADAGIGAPSPEPCSESRGSTTAGGHRDRYQRSFEAAQDGILLIDLSTGRVVDCNPALLHLTGCAREDIIDQPWQHLDFLPQDSDWFRGLNRPGAAAPDAATPRSRSLCDANGVRVQGRWRLHGFDVDHGRILQCTLELADPARGPRADGAAPAAAEPRHNLLGVTESLACMLAARDPYTQGHQQRVAMLCQAIAQVLGLPADQIEGLRVAAGLHDIGKIAIPLDLLTKPTQLKPEEYQLIKTHVQSGFEILRPIEFPWPVATIVHQHHERLDGSGYPSGLQGDGILLEARILSVADTVESMASERPYRRSRGLDAALHLIETGRGRLYDAEVADACLHLFRQTPFQLPEMEELLHR